MQKQTIIDAKKSPFALNIQELIAYRDLFVTLTWRDFKVRYAQTTLGLLWAFVQPLATISILSFVFGNFLPNTSEVPHLLFVVSGMSCWTYFSFVVTNAGNSIVNGQDLVKKIYFPRIIIPFSKAMVGFIDLFICLLLLFGLMFYYEVSITARVFILPALLLGVVLTSLGVGIWLSALTVRFRDIQHVIPFMVQIGLYLTPVAYSSNQVLGTADGWIKVLYFLNPIAGFIEGLRWCLFTTVELPTYFYLSPILAILLFLSGIYYFQKTSDKIADIV